MILAHGKAAQTNPLPRKIAIVLAFFLLSSHNNFKIKVSNGISNIKKGIVKKILFFTFLLSITLKTLYIKKKGCIISFQNFTFVKKKA